MLSSSSQRFVGGKLKEASKRYSSQDQSDSRTRHPAVAATAATRHRGRGSSYNFVHAVAAVSNATMRLAGLARPRRETVGKGGEEKEEGDYGFDTRRVELSGVAAMLFRGGSGPGTYVAVRGICALFCLLFSTMEKRWTRLRPRPPRSHIGALAAAERDVSRLFLKPIGPGTVALSDITSESELWSALLRQELEQEVRMPWAATLVFVETISHTFHFPKAHTSSSLGVSSPSAKRESASPSAISSPTLVTRMSSFAGWVAQSALDMVDAAGEVTDRMANANANASPSANANLTEERMP